MPKKSKDVAAAQEPAQEATAAEGIEEIVPQLSAPEHPDTATFVLDGSDLSDGDGDGDGDGEELGDEYDDDGVPFEHMDELADAMMHVAEQLSTDDGESFANVLVGIREQLTVHNGWMEKQVKILNKLCKSVAP